MIECEEKTILNLLPEKVIRSLNVLTIKNFKEKYHLTGLKVPYSELLYSRIVDKMSTSRVIEIDLRAMMRRHDVFFCGDHQIFFSQGDHHCETYRCKICRLSCRNHFDNG